MVKPLFPRRERERALEIAETNKRIAEVEAETRAIEQGVDDADDDDGDSNVMRTPEGGIRVTLANGGVEDLATARDLNALKRAIEADRVKARKVQLKQGKLVKRGAVALKQTLNELSTSIADLKRWRDEAEAAAVPATDEMLAMSGDLIRIGEAIIAFVDSSIATVNRLDKANDWMIWAANGVRALSTGFASGAVKTLGLAIAAALNALAFYDVTKGIRSIFMADLDAYAPLIPASAGNGGRLPLPIS